MPTATLTFHLPDESEEHETTIHAMAYRSTLSDIDQELRRNIKYGDWPQNVVDMLEVLRGVIRDGLDGIPLP